MLRAQARERSIRRFSEGDAAGRQEHLRPWVKDGVQTRPVQFEPEKGLPLSFLVRSKMGAKGRLRLACCCIWTAKTKR